MIEINTQQFCFTTEQFTFDAMFRLLQDNFLDDNCYIEIVMENGLKAAIRKKDIIAINEISESEGARG